ncbi:oligopeptide ABC transporter [Acinetobacter haemolyticus]|nr:oligopeptide ABC transporter [Acinetobacter haemolyticus]
MSPVMKSRLARFKKNKLGFQCFILFTIVFILSLAAEFIANDKPLLVKYQDSFYFPVFKDYPETTYGGVFETATDYQDPAVRELISAHGWMISPIVPFSYQTPNLELTVPVPSKPTAQNWLGTDDQGRDVFGASAVWFEGVVVIWFCFDNLCRSFRHHCGSGSGLLWWLGRLAWTAYS